MGMDMNKRFDGLTGVRGVGALGIIAYHVYVLGGYSGSSHYLDRTVGVGGVFVQLFFMLSSFSLMCGYAEKFRQKDYDLETFYIGRFRKLAPAFYFALLCYFLLDWWEGSPDSIYALFGTGSFLYALMPAHQESVVMAGWALGIEVVFYLLFPAWLIFTKNKKRAWLMLAFTAGLFLAYNRFYGIGAEQAHININLQLVFFAAGSLLYHYIPKIQKLSGKYRILFGVLCLAVETACLFLWGRLDGNLILVIAFSAWILNQVNGFDKIMECGIMKWIGSISYPMYLFHMIVYRLLMHTGWKGYLEQRIPKVPLQYLLFYLTVTAGTILLSALFRFVSGRITKGLRNS